MNKSRFLFATSILCLVLTGGMTHGEPIDDARKAFADKEYAKVDTVLQKILDRLNPPPEALRLSLDANIAQGNYVTASSRVDTLLRITENRDLELVYKGAELAALIGDETRERERLRYFALHQAAKNEKLDRAFSRLLSSGIYPEVYQNYIKVNGATDQAWTHGLNLLNRLIQAYDGAQTREQAEFLMKTFATPQQINAVVGRLRYAADDFVLGKGDARYREALEAIAGHPFTDQGQVHHMINQVADRLNLMLKLQSSCPNPFYEALFNQFNTMHDVTDQTLRLAMGKQFLEFEPKYQKHEDASHYLRYVTFIAHRPQVFQVENQVLVTSAHMQRMFEALVKSFPDSPEKLHDLSHYVIEHYVKDAGERTAFIKKHAPAIRRDRLALAMGEGYADAPEVVKLTGNNLWTRHQYLAYLKDPAMKAEILNTVRDWVMAHPAHFDGADLGRKLRDNPVPSVAEKVAVLRELYQKIGYTEQMKRLVDEIDNLEEIKESDLFKAFVKEFEEWKAGNDALALAQISFWGKTFEPNDPKLQAAVQEAFKAYGGKYPIGKDWKRDKVMRDILDRYRGIVWGNKDAVFAWADFVAPQLGSTDYWDDMIRRVREHGGTDRLAELAKPYLAQVDSGWEGRPSVWSELRLVQVPKDSETTFLSSHYKQLGRYNAYDFLRRNGDRLTQQAYVAETEKLFQAYPLAAWSEDAADDLLTDVWHRTRNHADAKAVPTRIVADSFWDFFIAKHDGDRHERNRAFEMTVKLDGIDKAVEKYLAYANTKDPVLRATLASELIEFGLQSMPREENGAELKPGHRGHFILQTIRPFYAAVPAEQQEEFWLHEWALSELAHLVQHGHADSKPPAAEMQAELGNALLNGAAYWGNRHYEYPVIDALIQKAIQDSEWEQAMRAAQYLGSRFHESWNWSHIQRNHVEPLTELMVEAEAWEILYVFTKEALDQNPEKGLEARLINTKAQAARHIGGLYPVSADDPMFDLFRAADEYASGNLGKAWDLTRPKLKLLTEHWLKFDKTYMAWVAEQMRLQKMFEPAQNLSMTMLLEEEQITPEAAGAILLTRADIYRDMKNYEAAKIEYEALKDNKRYAMTEAGTQAGFRLVDLLIRTGAYDSAEMILERWRTHSHPEMRAQAHFYLSLIAFERQEYDNSREGLTNVFDIQYDHTEGRLLEGELKALTGKGVGEPEIPIGAKGERDYIVPGRQLTVSVTDKNLAIVRQGQSIPVVVTTSVGKDRERISLYPSSSSPHKFKAVLSTALGDAVEGDMKLQLMGTDVIRYEIDPAFVKDNDLDPFPAKTLSVIDDARLSASAGRIFTEKEQQELALEMQIAETRSQSKRDYGRTGTIVRPGNFIYVQVMDADRDVSPEKDTVHVDISTSSGDVVEQFPLTETEPHSGVFRARLETAIPPPRASASDTAQGSDPSVLINSGKSGMWQSSTADANGTKWIEVDTMSSHDIKLLTIDLPDPSAVAGVKVQGMLTGDLFTLGSFPASDTNAKGGVIQQVVPNRHQEHQVWNMRNITIRAGEVSGPHEDVAFDRNNTEFKDRNGWMISRIRGSFYVDESKTYEFKFIHEPSPHNWQYAYLVIDGESVLGGVMNGNTIKETGTVVLSSGVHQYELFVRDHWQKSRAEVGYRQDDGTYASLPKEWFSTDENPELAEALREKATIQKTETGFAATFEKPQRLRSVRWVFTDFSGNAVEARQISVVNAEDEVIIPCAVDFSSATTNRILEIAPGDSVDVVYEDEVRTRKENAVLSATLGAEFYNGTIRIANEIIKKTDRGMESVYDDAIRFRPGDQVTILVEEFDKDISADADTLEIKVTTSKGETLTLKALEMRDQFRPQTEGIHTGLFYAVLRTGDTTQGNTIKVVPGDHIEASYLDSENTVPGIPVWRTAKVVEAGTSDPQLSIYRTSIEKVEDSSEIAKRQLDKMKLRGKDVDDLVIFKDQLVAVAPELLLEESEDPAAGDGEGGDEGTPDIARASMNVPLLFQVFYPSMALNLSSSVTATLVTDEEYQAAKQEGRQPTGTDAPLTIERLATKAARKGYDVRVESTSRYTDEQLMTKGVFSGVVRLQIGGPNDPIDDIVRTGDLAAAANSDIDRIATVLISKPQTLHILIRDADQNIVSETPVQLASRGRLELLDNTYTASKPAIHVGERFYVRLTDPDRNTSAEQDQVTVTVKSNKTGSTQSLVLTETMPYSGVFTASLKPYLKQQIEEAQKAAPAADDAADEEAPAELIPENPFLVEFGDTISFSYHDPVTLTNTTEDVHTEGLIHLGADGKLAVFSKKFKDPEMAVKVRFLRAESLFEMAKDYRKLKETEKSEALIAEGRRILTEALRDYPNTTLISQGQYLLANLSQELAEDEQVPEEQRQLYQEAIGKYSNILSTWPDSDYAPQAQFKLAICLEKLNDYDRATEEYVKLTYTYPEHKLVSDATVRLGNHYYKTKRFGIAGEIFYNFQQRFQDHPLAPKALFLAAQCHMKKAQVLDQKQQQAQERADELREAVDYLTLLLDTYRDDNELRAESMYWIGDNQFKMNDFRKSYIAFKKLTFDYPASEWAKRARGYLTDQKFARIEE